jgi:hypothetical protein
MTTTLSPPARPLVVLNVNDKEELPPSDYNGLFRIENAKSIARVQKILRANRSRATDLFLIDIDMEAGGHADGLQWGHPVFRAYGPLLALPFLNGRTAAAFVPYSGFWGNPGVTENGFVRVALALLLSHIHDKPFTLTDVGDYVQEAIAATETDAGLLQAAVHALTRALDIYRQQIESDPRIQLVDIDRTIARLKDLDEHAFETDSWPIAVPFRDGAGSVGVDLCYADGSRDSIQVASLFADLLGFAPPADSEAMEPLYTQLKRWKDLSVTCHGATLYETVLEVLDRGIDGVRADCAADESEFVKGGGNRYLLIRLAMEFAWLDAWCHEPNPKKRIEHVHRLLGLANNKNRSVVYKRFLGVSERNTVTPSAEQWRTPLKQRIDPKSTNDAYSLDTNDVGTLGPVEKQLCIQYAVERLDWQPSRNLMDPPYPRWLAGSTDDTR